MILLPKHHSHQVKTKERFTTTGQMNTQREKQSITLGPTYIVAEAGGWQEGQ